MADLTATANHVLPLSGRTSSGTFAARCPAMRRPSARRSEGVLWDGETAIPRDGGWPPFVDQSLPVIAQAQDFVFQVLLGHGGYGDHPRSRSAHGVRVYDLRSNRTICVTHMARAARSQRQGRHAAAAGAGAPAPRIVAPHLQPEDLVVICGDFNVEPGSETLRLLEASGLTELVTIGGLPARGPRTMPSREGSADYMLVSRPARGSCLRRGV